MDNNILFTMKMVQPIWQEENEIVCLASKTGLQTGL
jgi:hypothetical protein